jgi:hypothetical protein
LDNVVVAWNDSRESARALAEALPYLHQARKVGVLILEGEHSTEADALKGNEAVHPGITASMRENTVRQAKKTRLPKYS